MTDTPETVVITERIYGPGPTPGSQTLLAVPGNIVTAAQKSQWDDLNAKAAPAADPEAEDDKEAAAKAPAAKKASGAKTS